MERVVQKRMAINLFSRSLRNRTKNNGCELQQGTFALKIRKELSKYKDG